MRKHTLAISIVISILLVAASIYYHFSLDVLQKIFSIIGSFSIVLALVSYVNKKKQDATLAAIDQISFFRTEALERYNRLIILIRDKLKDPNYMPPSILIKDEGVSTIRKKYKNEVESQIKIGKLEGLWNMQVEFLNILEELSLRIIHTDTSDHRALLSIRQAFVMLVEMNAVVLLTHKEVISGSSVYHGVLELYNKWEPNIDRATPEERIKKITYE